MTFDPENVEQAAKAIYVSNFRRDLADEKAREWDEADETLPGVLQEREIYRTYARAALSSLPASVCQWNEAIDAAAKCADDYRKIALARMDEAVTDSGKTMYDLTQAAAAVIGENIRALSRPAPSVSMRGESKPNAKCKSCAGTGCEYTDVRGAMMAVACDQCGGSGKVESTPQESKTGDAE